MSEPAGNGTIAGTDREGPPGRFSPLGIAVAAHRAGSIPPRRLWALDPCQAQPTVRNGWKADISCSTSLRSDHLELFRT